MKNQLPLILFFFVITASLCNAQNPILYGTTVYGGTGGVGNIFQINSSDTTFSNDFNFYFPQSPYPSNSVIQASNGLLYGTTIYGGANDSGMIFSYNIISGVESDLHDFGSGTDGQNPYGSLMQATNGLLYGMTYGGGVYDSGTIFSYNITTGAETDIYDFGTDSVDGLNPYGSLIQVTDSLLYGMTESGGVYGLGMMFSYNLNSDTEIDLHDFGSGTDGLNPHSSLVLANDGLLYGMTYNGGLYNGGIVFSYDISTATETDIYDFVGDSIDGLNPIGSLIQANDGQLYGMTEWGGISNEGIIFNYNIASTTETVLYNFGGSYGQNPQGSLVQATSGLLYGTTEWGGADNEGTIFTYNTSTGAETDIHDFGIGKDGNFPNGTIIQASNTLLYGMSEAGGANGAGTIFCYHITQGIETDIYDFGKGNVGQYPYSSLIQASNGLLYGMTKNGGESNASWLTGGGTIFNYNVYTGIQTDIYNFGSGTDGAGPYGSLIQASNNLLYGMTEEGGVNDSGIIFSYNILTGKDTDLHDFGSGTDGKKPYGSLIQSNDSLLYGMTRSGGVNDSGIIFSYNILTGKDTDLHDFGSSTDGKRPYGSLLQASNGLLYGMTYGGGTNDSGTIFSYTVSTGTETDLHDFGSSTDGYSPYGSLIQVGDSLLYGMTSAGGANGVGIIFSYNIFTNAETDSYDFGSGTDGYSPYGSLFLGSDGMLYGMTSAGGAYGLGMVFRYNIDSGKETDMHDFMGSDGQYPYSNLIEDDVTGIKQLSVINKQLTIYPNPTSGQFTIKLQDNQNGYTVEVYNMMGEEIYQSVIYNSLNNINLSSQPSGMYFVYLKSQEGVEVGKVLVTK